MGKQAERAVGQLVLPIGPWAQATSDQASLAESRPPRASTGPAVPVQERGRKCKWYSLHDKVTKKGTRYEAFVRVRDNHGAPGCDGMTIGQIEREGVKPFLRGLRTELREKRYRPRPVQRRTIPKPGGGQRHLGIPTVRDRIVQSAVRAVLEPIFEEKFSEHSHGFRPGRGCRTALADLDAAFAAGYEWVVDADIKSFFDTVDHQKLMDAVAEEVADGSVLRLLRMFLEAGVLVGDEEIASPEGTPQGGPLSPLLANIYLHPLDQELAAAGYRFVRYADDFVVLAGTRGEAEEALVVIRRVLARLGLRLNEHKTQIVHIDDRFDFLGFCHFRYEDGAVHRVVRRGSIHSFRAAVRARTPRHGGQRPRRRKSCTVQRLRRDEALQRMITEVNRYLRGWYGYFREVTGVGRHDMRRLDGFVRHRARSAIAGRHAHGYWHMVLPTRLLAELGLESLERWHDGHWNAPICMPTSGYLDGSRMR